VYVLGFLGGESGTCSGEVASLLASETEAFLHTPFSFFWSELANFDNVDDHGVWVVGGFWDKGVVPLFGRLSIPGGDFFGALPLGLEGGGLLISFVNGGGVGFHGHHVFHEFGVESCSEVSDSDIWISDSSEDDIASELGNVFLKGNYDGSIYFVHSDGGEPVDGVSDRIVVFKGIIELGEEVGVCAKGDSGP
jgi:hypothetical protein